MASDAQSTSNDRAWMGRHGKAMMTRGAGWKMHIWTSLADCTANSKWPIQSVCRVWICRLWFPIWLFFTWSKLSWVTCYNQLGEHASWSILAVYLESFICNFWWTNKQTILFTLLRILFTYGSGQFQRGA